MSRMSASKSPACCGTVRTDRAARLPHCVVERIRAARGRSTALRLQPGLGPQLENAVRTRLDKLRVLTLRTGGRCPYS